MGASNRTTRIAVGISALSFLLFLIAFVSPYWLVTDGRIANPRFTNLGLWEVCFNHFRIYIAFTMLSSAVACFYVAVQAFATLCFVMCLIALPLTLAFLRTSRDDDRYVVLLLTIGSCQVVASIFGFIAVVIFGAKGDSRDWMPGWQNNDMGWSFALAVVGGVMLLPAGILYLVEARRERYRHLNEISNREVSEYGGPSDDYYQQQAQQYFAPEPSRPRRPPPGQSTSAAAAAAAALPTPGGIQTDI